MDINAILPLLMNKMNNGGMGNEKMNALLKLTKGEKPDMGEVMNMAMNSRNNATKPFGIKEIASFAPTETLGKLIKFFLF